MAQETKTNTLAIVSLVLGIISLPGLVCYGCGGVAFGIAALVTGFIARRRIRDSDGMETGQGLALAGIILGATGAVLGLLLGASIVGIAGLTMVGPGIQEMFEDISRELGVQM